MHDMRSNIARVFGAAALAGLMVSVFTLATPEPAHAQLGNMLSKAMKRNAQAEQQNLTPAPAESDATGSEGEGVPPAQQFNRQWLGYSQNFQALRPFLLKGDFANAKAAFETGKDVSGAAVPLPVNPDILTAGGATPPGASGFMALAAAARAQGRPGGVPQTSGLAQSGGVLQPMAQAAAPFITNVEVGTLLLDAGDFTSALAAFDLAGQTAAGTAARSTASRAGGMMRSIGRGAASLAGNAEMGAYDAPDYERVLQLNYLSLAYLLNGDAKAFNVSQRVADRQREAFNDLNERAAKLQDEARTAFEAERAKAQQELASAQSNPDQSNPGQRTAPGETGDAKAVNSQLSAAYASPDYCKAPNVASAFVNPLSFYLNGIVYEISSAQYREDRDTARISYEKALQLAPNAGVLAAAVRDLNSQQVRPGRLTHVLVAEGFAPTRQAIRMQLNYGEVQAPITIPRLTCHPSEVAAIEVRALDGRTLSRLDKVADIEGMMLQRQKDREAITAAAVLVNVVRGALENRAAQQAGMIGQLLVQAKQSAFDRPDMRSWSTLPARVFGGRVYVPNDVAEVDIVSLNANGQVVATSRSKLDTQSRQNVVYARATPAALAVAPAAQLWIRGL